ncbi:MAG: hypothetical protein ACLTBV_33540 [Enterocloster bolteae]
MIRLNDREFCEIVEYIRDNYGINLEKEQVLIECRMARELEKRGLTSFAQHMEQMRKDRTGEMAGEHGEPPDDQLYLFYEGAGPFFYPALQDTAGTV